MPDILKVFIDKDKIPHFMNDTDWGHRFWGAFFSVSDKVADQYDKCSSLYCYL